METSMKIIIHVNVYNISCYVEGSLMYYGGV
jgi:hypothetical protein